MANVSVSWRRIYLLVGIEVIRAIADSIFLPWTENRLSLRKGHASILATLNQLSTTWGNLSTVAQEVKILGYTWLVTNHADFAHAVHKASQRVILDDLILVSLTRRRSSRSGCWLHWILIRDAILKVCRVFILTFWYT